MKKSNVTQSELNKLDRLLAKRGFEKTDNRFFNPGTKVSVSLYGSEIVFSYKSEMIDVKSVREFVQANTKKRKVK